MYSLILAAAMTAPADTASFGGRSGCGNCGQGQSQNRSIPTLTYGFAGCYGSCYGSITNYFSYWSQPIEVHYGYGMPKLVGPATKMDPPVAPPKTDPPAKPKDPPAKPMDPPAKLRVKPTEPPAKPTEPPVKPVEPKPAEPKNAAGVETASVIVTLPVEATLFANGVRTNQTTGERNFVTPSLEQGKTFRYVLTIELVRNGRTITETREIEVEAGSEIRVNFPGKGDPAGVATND